MPKHTFRLSLFVVLLALGGPRTFTSALFQPVEETIDLRLISASILHRPGP